MINGYQDFWVVGAAVQFQRDPIEDVEQPIFDWGVITTVTPTFTPTTISLKDSRSGVRVTVAEDVTDFDETYEFACANFAPDNLALTFAGVGVETFTQAATPVTDVAHTAYLGRLLAIHDANGDRVFGITSIESITQAATPVVLGTDYEVVDLEQGLIRILPGSSVVADGDTVNIDYTPRAVTGKRLIHPQTAKAIKGTMWLVLSRGNNSEQTVRECKVSLTANSPEFHDDNYSSLKLKASVINDPTNTTAPAGRLLNWKGSIPDLS
jgi:hypothetical protein